MECGGPVDRVNGWCPRCHQVAHFRIIDLDDRGPRHAAGPPAAAPSRNPHAHGSSALRSGVLAPVEGKPAVFLASTAALLLSWLGGVGILAAVVGHHFGAPAGTGVAALEVVIAYPAAAALTRAGRRTRHT
jgi:hypothetical protein